MESIVLITRDDVANSDALTSPRPEDVARSGVDDRVSAREVRPRRVPLEPDRIPVNKKHRVSPAGVP